MTDNDLLALRKRAETYCSELNFELSKEKKYNIKRLVSEVELHKIELEIQNEDLINTQAILENSLRNYKDLYELAPIAYFTLNENGIIIDANNSAAALLGIDKKSLINQSFARYIAPNYQLNFFAHRRTAFLSLQHEICELQIIKRNNPLMNIQLQSKVINTNDEKHLLCLAIEVNKKLENKVEELPTILAHELNHPFAIISNYLHGCIRRLKTSKFSTEDLIDAMNKAVLQSNRAAEILLRMKNFRFKGSLNYEKVCLNKTITETVALLHHEFFTDNLNLKIRPTNNLPLMNIDKLLVQQVLLNLTRNALEAMRDSNKKDPQLIIEINQLTKETVEIAIMDNGPGISLRDSAQLFNLDFTTKHYGVGLGLAVSRSIVEAHQGLISFSNNPAGGACFKFTLKSYHN